MPRRDDDGIEEHDEDRPRKRRRDEDEDSEEPRRRRRRDEDEDEDLYDRPRRSRRPEGNWLDSQFADTSIVLLVIFPVCCGIIALIFAIAGVAGCQTSRGRQRALIVLVISLVWIAIAVAVQLAGLGKDLR